MTDQFSSQVAVRPSKQSVYLDDYQVDGQRALHKIIWLQRVVIGMLCCVLYFYLSVHIVENRYFPTTEEGRIIPNVGLDEPNIGTPSLVSWISRATTDALNLSFHDYNRRLRDASDHFTRAGWAEFTEFLNDQQLFRRLKRGKALIKTSPATAPILQDQGVYIDAEGNRRYFWRLKMSLTMGFVAVQAELRTIEVLITVIRVPKLENGKGISIDTWELQSIK